MILDINNNNSALEGGERLFTCTLAVLKQTRTKNSGIVAEPTGQVISRDVVIDAETMLSISESPNMATILQGIQDELFIHTFTELTNAQSQ